MNPGEVLDFASDRLKSAWFRARRGRPFTTGYGAYKEERVRAVLDGDEFDVEALPPGFGLDLDERIIEYPWLFAHLSPGPGILLDAGSALNFLFLLTRPALADKALHICTLAPERRSFWRRGVSYTFQDLRRTCFRDAFFDHVVSLSTLEHVGFDNGRFYTGQAATTRDPASHLAAAGELSRVLRPGGRLYLTVPFGRHIELGWLQVFDGGMLDRVIEAFRPSGVMEHIFRYTPGGWQRSDRRGAADAEYVDLHTTRKWHSGLPVAAESVACLLLTK